MIRLVRRSTDLVQRSPSVHVTLVGGLALLTAVAFLPLGSGDSSAAAGAAQASGYAAEVLADSPRAYWRLGEVSGGVAVDETVNANTGSYVNGAVLGQAGALVGDANTAVRFDGVNDYLSVPDSASLDVNSAVTVEAWVKRAKTGWQVVIGKPGNGQSKFENYALWFDPANLLIAYFGNGSTYARVQSAGPVDTAWHHVAATYAGGTARLYIDGVESANRISTITLTPNAAALNVARDSRSAYIFGGSLDEIAVYGTALSRARISAHYTAGRNQPAAAPLVSLVSPVNGSVSNVASPTFSGTAGSAVGDSATVTVRVYAGAVVTATAARTLTATRSGSSWSVAAGPPFADGVWTAQAAQTNAAGSTGLSSASTFTVDTTAPAVTITAPANATTTTSPTPTLAGGAGAGAADGATIEVRIYQGSDLSGTLTQTLTTTRSGSSWTTTPSALANGTYTAQARQTDSAGNTGTSGTTTFTVATAAPLVSLVSPVNGSVSNLASPTFSGTAGSAVGDSATVTVRVYAGAVVTATAARTLTATRSGSSWSVAAGPPFADGVWTAQAAQTNAAGSTGLSSASTFTVDTTAPAVTITAPANATTTTSPTPTLAGGAGAGAADGATIEVRIYQGSDLSGTLRQTLTTTRSGSSWTTTPSALANGTYTAQARQTDSAGNTGTSGTTTFTVATAAPQSSYRAEVLADSPRAYWRLGEVSGGVAVDETVNANTGSYVNGAVLGQAGALVGDANTAVRFDGVNDYLSVPDSASLDVNSAVTVEAWVKRAKTGWQVVIGKPGNGQSKFENYALWFDPANLLIAYFGNGSTYARVQSAGPVDTAWHHVAATYAGGTARLYIDGVESASSISTITLTPNAAALNVARDSGNAYIFGGSLDEIAVYGTALSRARISAHYTAGLNQAAAATAVTLTTPASNSTTVDTTPVYAGMGAGTGTDSTTITVKVYEGVGVTGAPVQTLTTTRAPSGAWDVSASTPLTLGTYTARAEQIDNGSTTLSAPRTFQIVTRPAAAGDPELVGAGDIAYCQDTGDDRTALLLDGFPNATVFTLGDNAYESGTLAEFANCYDPTWGRAKARTRPALGDHDYADGADQNATGHMGYFSGQLSPFGASATDPNRGYYSYDIGTWHVVVLNSACGGASLPACSASTQLSWLQSDLAAHPVLCTLAILHAPRWSSGTIHGSNPDMQSYWNALANGGVEAVMGGDDHHYERFAPMEASGRANENGLRQFVIGTGGRSHYPVAGPSGIVVNSETRNDTTYGILRLVLRPGLYQWEFVPEAGGGYVDSGSTACH